MKSQQKPKQFNRYIKAKPVKQETRINKFIAEATSESRRSADELILAGKVKVNGEVVKELGMKVTSRDTVEVNGKKIEKLDKKYVIFHKPPGYITTRDDEKNRKTIYDILPPEMNILKPAGRLDKESSGLLLLTNDGELIMELTHPKHHVPKTYRVTVKGKVTMEHMMKMQKGIEIEPGKIAYAEGMILDYDKGATTLELVLHQGYNRQIRKMLEIIERPVEALKRISHANLNIAGLEKGKYRYLKPKEVRDLQNYLLKIRKENQKNAD